MSTMTDIQDYKDDVRRSGTETLGLMVIFSVNKTLVAHRDLAERLTAGGLEDYVPLEPKDENIFRRVWTDGVRITQRTATADDPDALERVMVRTLERKSGKVVKRIVIEGVSVTGQKLHYHEVLEARFEQENPHMVSIRNVGDWHPAAWTLVNALRDQYLDERGRIDENAVRAIVRAVLDDCHAAVLRPGGGVYFVTNRNLPKVEALEAASEIIDNCLVHTLPIVDTAKQRAALKRAVEMDSREELDRILEEMRGLVKSGTEITSQKAAAYATDSRKAKAKIREYKELLNDGMETVDVKLDLFDAVLGQLLTQVKS